MHHYKTKFEFSTENLPELEEKLKTYFSQHNFKFSEEGLNKFRFYKKGTLLDGWKSNPLNWESTVDIELTKANIISIEYTVEGNGQISPLAFASLYEAFLGNLELFINQDKDFAASNALQIKLAKKKMVKYFGIIFSGTLLGFVAGYIVSNLTGIKLFGAAGIVIGTTLAHNILNKILVRSYALQQYN